MEYNSLEKFELIFSKINEYDKGMKQIDRDFVYGTSGFRCEASIMHKVFFKIQFNKIYIRLLFALP